MNITKKPLKSLQLKKSVSYDDNLLKSNSKSNSKNGDSKILESLSNKNEISSLFMTKDLIIFDLDYTLIEAIQLSNINNINKNNLIIENFDNPNNNNNNENININNIETNGLLLIKNGIYYRVYFRNYLKKLCNILMNIKLMSNNKIIIVLGTMSQYFYATCLTNIIHKYFTNNKILFDQIYAKNIWKQITNKQQYSRPMKDANYIINNIIDNHNNSHIIGSQYIINYLRINNVYIIDDQLFLNDQRRSCWILNNINTTKISQIIFHRCKIFLHKFSQNDNELNIIAKQLKINYSHYLTTNNNDNNTTTKEIFMNDNQFKKYNDNIKLCKPILAKHKLKVKTTIDNNGQIGIVLHKVNWNDLMEHGCVKVYNL